ncbi:MAG: alpha-hydroxy-acid oxidizing protein [Acidobacteria bacterium]|nr:alpha-hydroxy-acid oxidizing protein [Acidobacteriota bacterium]
MTRKDAELALEYGADGIWVSKHGGGLENSPRSSVECVPEVSAGARDAS